MAMVKEVSDVTKLTWHQVFEMNIIEFLNVCCFNRDFNNYEKHQMEKWKAQVHL